MSRESLVDSYIGEQNRDIVTGANPTPHMVPEFLTGRPMQFREPCNAKSSTMVSLRKLSLTSLRLQTKLSLQTPLTVLRMYWSV